MWHGRPRLGFAVMARHGHLEAGTLLPEASPCGGVCGQSVRAVVQTSMQSDKAWLCMQTGICFSSGGNLGASSMLGKLMFMAVETFLISKTLGYPSRACSL